MAKYVVGEFSFAKKGEVEQLLRSALEEVEVGFWRRDDTAKVARTVGVHKQARLLARLPRN